MVNKMQIKEEIKNYIASHRDEILELLKELIRIPSVRGKAEKDAPFGKECARVLEFIEKLYRNSGFETELDQNGGYLLSYFGKGEKSLGLFAHADVVPVGNDWILTSPFSPIEKDGFLIGRGGLDDKAAVVISLYCAKMFKELGIPFGSRLIMFAGANEESGMEDIKNYLSKHTAPDFSLVVDSGYPLYRGDKGILHFVAKSSHLLKDIEDFSGGSAFNITLGEATAKYNGKVVCEKGISKHGALPEGSVNAGYLLAKVLLQKDDICEGDKKEIDFVAHTLENYYGEIFGIENTDPTFGRLTCINGMVSVNDRKLNLCFDMRYGTNLDIDEVKTKLIKYFGDYGWSVEFVKEQAPFCVSEDNPYIVSCLNTYKEFTNATEVKTYINAGGTYASKLPCAAEIGPVHGGGKPDCLPSGHGSVHQPDECLNIKGFLESIEITALMLLECDKTPGRGD